MPRRRADKIDENHSIIVKQLRSIPGVTVETGLRNLFKQARVQEKKKPFWQRVKEWRWLIG